uniref:Transmembrane protein 230 n=1 Tax=Fundulus heteroclitus TaxID=8078 RepID=A0A3Q2Q951_FUNHE
MQNISAHHFLVLHTVSTSTDCNITCETSSHSRKTACCSPTLWASVRIGSSKMAASDFIFLPLQFKRSPPKVPYKAIALASVLFLIGSILIVIGSLLLAGYFGVTNSDRTVPVLIIGIIVFLPGIYHLRIAYYASKGYPGYSYDDIPDFDD